MPLTAASLSTILFFKSETLIKPKISINIDSIIRKSYYGGRCEVFGNLYSDEVALHFDFRGMYAQCMCERVPCGELHISQFVNGVDKPGFYLITFMQWKSMISDHFLPIDVNLIETLNCK